MKKYICTICGFIYDEAAGIPDAGIVSGTKWDNMPADWKCPLCGATQSDFNEYGNDLENNNVTAKQDHSKLRELSNAELSALCSNLAKGCEKQYLEEESQLFNELTDYYKSKTPSIPENSFNDLILAIEKDLNTLYPNSNAIAADNVDRGAKRALLWSEKVTRILNSILTRYEHEEDAILEEGTKISVCDICGFIYIGNELPEICPVCKVPNFKIVEVRR